MAAGTCNACCNSEDRLSCVVYCCARCVALSAKSHRVKCPVSCRNRFGACAYLENAMESLLCPWSSNPRCFRPAAASATIELVACRVRIGGSACSFRPSRCAACRCCCCVFGTWVRVCCTNSACWLRVHVLLKIFMALTACNFRSSIEACKEVCYH